MNDHGGEREGAGRPAPGKPRKGYKRVTFDLDLDLVEDWQAVKGKNRFINDLLRKIFQKTD